MRRLYYVLSRIRYAPRVRFFCVGVVTYYLYRHTMETTFHPPTLLITLSGRQA
jgi:hypothetical protein